MVWMECQQEWLCIVLWSSPASGCGVSERHDTGVGRGHRPQEQKQIGQQNPESSYMLSDLELLELREAAWASVEEREVAVHVQQVIPDDG